MLRPSVLAKNAIFQQRSSVEVAREAKVDSLLHRYHFGSSLRFKLWVGGIVSFLAHVLMLLALALFAFAGQSSTGRPDFFTLVPTDNAGELHDVAFEIAPKIAPKVEVTQSELKQPSLATDVALASVELKLSIEVPVKEVASSLDDWRLFELEPSIAKRLERQIESKQNARLNASTKNNSSARGALANAMGSKGDSGNQLWNFEGARYFGSRALGKKFVFVVDGSGSMVSRFNNGGIRWKTATEELLRSLNELRSDYEFFVICFNVVEFPIFDHYPPNNGYLKNDPNTLRLVEEWITNFHPGGSTYPSRALQLAIEMKPDAVFLLSDGEIKDDSIGMLRRMNRADKYGTARVPIHTILLMSDLGQFTLQTIAKENGGSFRKVTYQEWLAAQMR